MAIPKTINRNRKLAPTANPMPIFTPRKKSEGIRLPAVSQLLTRGNRAEDQLYTGGKGCCLIGEVRTYRGKRRKGKGLPTAVLLSGLTSRTLPHREEEPGDMPE